MLRSESGAVHVQVPGVQRPCAHRPGRRAAAPCKLRHLPVRHLPDPPRSTAAPTEAELTAGSLPVDDVVSDVPGADHAKDEANTPFDRQKRGRSGLPLSEFAAGAKVKGIVASVQEYGVFVEFGCTKRGLLHISEASDGFIEPAKLASLYPVDSEVELYVGVVDLERQQVSLFRQPGGSGPQRKPRGSMRARRSPSEGVANKRSLESLAPNEVVSGRVVAVRDFGAFVDIGAVKDALIHKSQISVSFTEDVSAVLSVGQEVKGRLISVDFQQEKIAMSLKGFGEDEQQGEGSGRAPPGGSGRSAARTAGFKSAARDAGMDWF